MRLLLWVLLVTLVTFVSYANAASIVANSEESNISRITLDDIEALTRLLAAEDDDADAKRFLRSESKTGLKSVTDINAEEDDEERGLIPSSVTNLVSKLKNGWAKWKSNALEKAFQRMMKNGETPTSLVNRIQVGGATELRHERLIEKYTAWWINFHTKAGT